LAIPGCRQEFDATLHVERQLLEVDHRFVVFETSGHAQQHEAAFRQFGAGWMREIVRRSVHHQNTNMRRWAGIGLVERAFDRALERNEFRSALGDARCGCEAKHQEPGAGGVKI